MKREANFTMLFQRWLRANPHAIKNGAACFELKQTRGNSIPFSSVQDHQLDALAAAWGPEGISYKISDQSRGYKPFDLVYFRLSLAFIVVKYPKTFVIITASTWGSEAKQSRRKSLTLERAKEIAYITVNL